MITAAHVGVGIVGKEGKQASLASDFSINEFKVILELMLCPLYTSDAAYHLTGLDLGCRRIIIKKMYSSFFALLLHILHT